MKEIVEKCKNSGNTKDNLLFLYVSEKVFVSLQLGK